MPLRLDIKQQLNARSDRVKCVDMHPSEPWMLAALYSGVVNIWNYESNTMIKTFEVSDVPVRAARFIERKNWIVTGSDDMKIRVFNYNTLDKVHTFEAHTDYIRCLAVHPSQPYVLSCSDDMTIRMWDWEQDWMCRQVFEGHSHYVMDVVFNPKDVNTFASCSLDRTIKVWQLGASSPNFTLQGHEKGVNCVSYFSGGDKPYLVSGADDRLVKIWDYQSKACVQTLEGHTQNVCAVVFHPELPIILSGSEDGTVRVWHANTYNLESKLAYNMERVWSMATLPGSNSVAIGYDEGCIMIKLGRERPAMSMDSNGKVVMARHNDVQQAIVTKVEGELVDGEAMQLSTKDLGACEIYPQSMQHNPNGRFVVVCGDGEYIIHTALSFRNKAFGQALDFVWSADSSEYAVRESSTAIKTFKNFKEKHAIRPDFYAEGIFGGVLLGVKGAGTLSFFNWDSQELVRRIDIACQDVFWSDDAEYVLVSTAEEGCFVLKYNSSAVTAAVAAGEPIPDDGIEDAFEVVDELDDDVKTGTWVGSCFIYTNQGNRLNYYVGGEIVTVAHLDRAMYVLGYLASTGRVYLGDKELNIVSYNLPLAVLEYQTAVMQGDLDTADEVMPSIPADQRNRVAHFLEKQGYKQQALVVSMDPDHRFELALSLHKLLVARDIAQELASPQKWKLLAEAAMKKSMFDLAEECLAHANDFSGQLLLYTASGKADKMATLADDAARAGRNNIAFVSLFLQGRLKECVDLLVESDRVSEAALFARSYLPSMVPEVVAKWKASLEEKRPKLAQSLADPTEYANLFPDFEDTLALEEKLKAMNVHNQPAKSAAAHLAARASAPLKERLASTQPSATGSTSEPPADKTTAAPPATVVADEGEPDEASEPEMGEEDEQQEQEEQEEQKEEQEEEEMTAPEVTQEAAAPAVEEKQAAEEEESKPPATAANDDDDDDDFDLDDDDLDLGDVDPSLADDLDDEDLLA